MNICKMGIDLGGTKLLCFANNGDQIFQEKFTTGNAATIEQINNCISEFIIKHKINPEIMGIAIPGLIENNSLIIESDVLQNLNNYESSDFLPEFRIPKILLNDVDASAIYAKMQYPDKQFILSVMAGTGIGLGIYINNKLFKGRNGFAGELGYMPLPTLNGTKNLDQLASGTSILESFAGDAVALSHALESNDANAVQIIDRAATHLGIALAGLINIFNPDLLAIGGGTCRFLNYFDICKNTVIENTNPFLLKDLDIVLIETNLNVAKGALQFAQL